MEVSFLLLPATLLYLYFAPIFVLVSFKGDGLNSQIAMFDLELLLLGYALFSLWWLVFKHRAISFKEIPKFVWVGIGIGCLGAVILILDDLFPHPESLPEAIRAAEGVSVASLFVFGGPLFMAVSTVVLVAQTRYGRL